MAVSEKGTRYLAQLDAARCNGQWNQVEELARKVEKHVPNRKCLVATARAEAKIDAVKPGKPENKKALVSMVESLEIAIESEKSRPDDKYQAQTCLAWLYWNSSDYSNAKKTAPRQPPNPQDGKKISDYTTVCIVKAAFFRASSEEGLGHRSEIASTYGSCLATLESLRAPTSGLAEFCYWWERFFSRCCGSFYGLFQDEIKGGQKSVDTRSILRAFRAWSSMWEHLSKTITTETDSAKQKRDQRLLVWRAYYHVLAAVLKNGYRYPPPIKTSALQNGDGPTSNRKLLYLELRNVEVHYQAMLVRQTSFPKANETNSEVHEFVNLIMATWATTSGLGWQEEDLDKGGRAAASRRVLESLYLAASLTFHSTSVLRHLFTVHASLAEFFLAEKALDSYIEIIYKGKARVKKSGVPEAELDNDEIMLQTIASGIEMLCEFGRRPQIEKSISVADNLLKWVEENGSQLVESTQSDTSSNNTIKSNLAAQVLASVHRAVAISRASWARLTYESRARAGLQAEGIKHFQDALRIDHTAEEDPGFLYPLAILLAETSNIGGAIAVLKQALSAESRAITDSVHSSPLGQDVRLRTTRHEPMIECWHLMALLLSSRQDFDKAETAVETALQQYDDKTLGSDLSTSLRSIPFFKKKQIIEAKMTQIAIAEVSENPQDAINISAQLVSLYSQFFDLPKAPQSARVDMEKPPPTATGTIKSVRGSIFGGRKSIRSSMVSLPKTNPAVEDPLPPTIAVTADETNTARPISTMTEKSPAHTNLPTRSPSHKLQKRHSRHSVRSSRLAPSIKEKPAPPVPAVTVGDTPVDDATHPRPESSWSDDPSEIGLAVSHDARQDESNVQVARAVSMRQASGLQLGGAISSKQISSPPKSPEVPDFTLRPPVSQTPPFYMPSPVFTPAEEQKYSIALLNSIWLFIAALYRRADMQEDARQALDEAFKQARLAETYAAKSGASSAKTFDESGWGGIKSVEEIWADTYAEEGHLCLAENDPYEAMVKYEGALSHYPDHAGATTALASILLDIHAKKIPLRKEKPSLARGLTKELKDESSLPIFTTPVTTTVSKPEPNGVDSAVMDEDEQEEEDIEATNHRDSSKNNFKDLDLLASRDRAYTLLSNLTKLGTGYDDSEAWFALANAYEASGQIDKAKEVLWWVVELEEKKPIRHWRVLGQGYKPLA